MFIIIQQMRASHRILLHVDLFYFIYFAECIFYRWAILYHVLFHINIPAVSQESLNAFIKIFDRAILSRERQAHSENVIVHRVGHSRYF